MILKKITFSRRQQKTMLETKQETLCYYYLQLNWVILDIVATTAKKTGNTQLIFYNFMRTLFIDKPVFK